MAVNMNYSLINGETSDKFYIPKYRKGYTPVVYSESQIINMLSEFSQELRESTYQINNINRYMLEDVDSITNIVDSVDEVLDTVIASLRGIVGKTNASIHKILANISEYNKKDSVYLKYGTAERIRLITEILNDHPHTMSITNLIPSEELQDDDFPDMDIIGEDLVALVRDAMDFKSNKKTLDDLDMDATEGLVGYVSRERVSIVTKIFGKYLDDIDHHNIIIAAKKVSDVVFGSTIPTHTEITPAIYLQACDNMDRGNDKIAEQLKEYISDIESNYTKLISAVDGIRRRYLSTISSYKENDKGYPAASRIDVREEFSQISNEAVKDISQIINAVNVAVSANINILTHKIKRLDQIFGTDGDSAAVISYCHNLMLTDTVSDSGIPSAIEPDRASYEIEHEPFLDEQEKFNSAMEILKECFLEIQFNDFIESVLMEADDHQSAENAAKDMGVTPPKDDNSANNQNNNQNNNNSNETKKRNILQKIWDFIKGIIDAIIGMFKKFTQRIKESILKVDAPFWNANRASIEKMDLSQVTVNDWYSYNFEAMRKPIVEAARNECSNKVQSVIQQGASDNKSFLDNVMLAYNDNFILDAIAAKNNFENDDDAFGVKCSKRFYTNYVDKSSNEVTLSSVGYDHKTAFDFVDALIRVDGNNDPYRKAAEEDLKNLKEMHRLVKTPNSDASKVIDILQEVNKEYEAYQKNNNTNSNTNTNTNSNNTNQNNSNQNNGNITPNNNYTQNTKSQNASAIYDDEMMVNLSEIFGISRKKDSGELPFIGLSENITVPDSARASDQSKTENTNSRNAAVNAYMKVMNKWYSSLSIACTTRFTTIMKAYKQYMALYKAVYGQGQKKSNTNDQTNSAQNDNQPSNEKK